MAYTDKTLPITCGECSQTIDGIPSMAIHILDEHEGYSVNEALQHARYWASDAYDILEQEERDYHISRKQEDRDD